MRTLLAGLRALKATPFAIVPVAAAGAMSAILISIGAFPQNGAAAPSSAAFPMDVFFDLKQGLAHASSWFMFAVAVAVSVAVRSAILTSTLWLADGRPGPFVAAWRRAAPLTARAALALFPSAAFFFIGVATRYAPFIWIAGILGYFAALAFARRGAALDVGAGAPAGKEVPEAAPYLAYGYFVALTAAAMSILAGVGPWAVALVPLLASPFHALMLLGWRAHLKEETYPGGGALAAAVTAVALIGLFGATVYTRSVREPPPVATVIENGTLLVLGGVDTTCETGAFEEFDPRQIGFARNHARIVSYSSERGCYSKEDTHADLQRVATIVSDQIAGATPPVALLGHSQAALVEDRILYSGLDAPDISVEFAPPPPIPPSISIPDPGVSGPGRVGGDIGRAISGLADLIGLDPFDLDAANSPTNLKPVVADDSVPRLALWALGDSVWLDGDWRRDDHLNVVVLTDHVGATRDGRGLDAARRFLEGAPVKGDAQSWRGALVSVFRYAFEPWRPQ